MAAPDKVHYFDIWAHPQHVERAQDLPIHQIRSGREAQQIKHSFVSFIAVLILAEHGYCAKVLASVLASDEKYHELSPLELPRLD